ncbi:MAG: DUF1801 domain-containing protein [Myxococcales bacterium]
MAARTKKPKPAPEKASKSFGKAPAKAKAKSKKAAAKPASKAKAAPKAKAVAKPQAKAAPNKAKAAPSKAKAAPSKAKTKLAAKAAPKAAAKQAVKSHAAREALKELAMKKAIAEVITPIESGTAVVDAYMRDVDHPFKAEMEAVRAIILGASSKIAERIKWNAPSFYYKEDLGAFHPRATEYAHLILLFPGGAGIPAKSALLEGKQKDRREAKFFSLSDIEAKRPALEKLVRDWVAARDA